MAAITDAAHRFRYTTGGNHGAANPSAPQLAALETEGPLLTRPTHVLAKALRRDAAGVDATITSRELERLFGKRLIFAADLLALPVRWVGTARSWSQLVADIDAAGDDGTWDPPPADDGDPIATLATRFATLMAGMPAAPLSWAAAQVSQVAALAGGWPDHVTAKMLRSVDTDNEMFVQYRGRRGRCGGHGLVGAHSRAVAP